MSPADWLLRAAQKSPTSPALLQGEKVVADYREFALRAAAIGTGLQTLYGVSKGARVAIYLDNSTNYLELLYGIWMIGAIAVPINAKLHAKEAAWIVEDCEATVVLVDPKKLEATKQVEQFFGYQLIAIDASTMDVLRGQKPILTPVSYAQNDPVWIFYTSGTTGRPKGAMLSLRNIQTMTMSYFVGVDHIDQVDCALYAAPISHGAGMYNFAHVLRGARHCVPNSGGFDAEEILTLAPRIRNISFFAAPTMVRRLVKEAIRLKSDGEGIKSIVYGGGPMYVADIKKAVEVLGNRFIQIYGQGECPMSISSLSRLDIFDGATNDYDTKIASVGRAQSLVEIQIRTSDGRELASGSNGEIWVKGDAVMLGYWRNVTATNQAIADGWLNTGDMGALDENGYLTLQDRSKDVIISGGSNIYPREVEEVLLTNKDVSEVSVVGAPDPEWGEIVVAFVVCDNPDANKLDELCNAQIARFKRPKRYVFVSELPKNNYGKVLKTELRRQLTEEAV